MASDAIITPQTDDAQALVDELKALPSAASVVFTRQLSYQSRANIGQAKRPTASFAEYAKLARTGRSSAPRVDIRNKIDAIRAEPDKDKRAKLKLGLLTWMPSIVLDGEHRVAVYKRDRKGNLPAGVPDELEGVHPWAHTGVISMDWDHADDPAELKRQLSELPHCFHAATSASGSGVASLHTVSPLPKTPDHHRAAFDALAADCRERGLPMGLLDSTPSSPVSARFQTYDPDAYEAATDAMVTPCGWEMPTEPIAPPKPSTNGHKPTAEVPLKAEPQATPKEIPAVVSRATRLKYLNALPVIRHDLEGGEPRQRVWRASTTWAATAAGLTVEEIQAWFDTEPSRIGRSGAEEYLKSPKDNLADWDGGEQLQKLYRAERKRQRAAGKMDEALDAMASAAGYGPDPNQQQPQHFNLWLEIGRFAAKRVLAGLYLHDPRLDDKKGWFWLWDTDHWALLPKGRPDPMIDRINKARWELVVDMMSAYGKERGEQMAAAITNDREFATRRKELSSDFWTGIRLELTEVKEDLPKHMVAAKNGIVDLLNLQAPLVPHSPSNPWLVRRVAGANYIAKKSDDSPIRDILAVSISNREDQDRWLWSLARSLSGRAGHGGYGGIIALIAEGGSGKGFLIRYAEDTFGGYCVPADQTAFLAQSGVNEGIAAMIEQDAVLVTIGEVTNTGDNRLLNKVTGADGISASKKWMPTIKGRLNCAVMVSLPQVPQMNLLSGSWRRMMPLYLDGKVADRHPDKARDEYTTPDENDTLLSLLVHMGAALYSGHKPDALHKEPPKTRDFMVAGDPLADWLSLRGEDYHGMPISELYREWYDERPDQRLRFSGHTAFGNAIGASEIRKSTGWAKERRTMPVESQYAGGQKARLIWVGTTTDSQNSQN